MTLLRLDDLSLSFRAVKALSGVSFTVARHEICALVGPNGAGKSSLLNAISGVYRCDRGRITLDGETRAYFAPREAAQRGIARTFQNLAIFRGMTVLENVLTGRSLAFRASWIEQTLGAGRAPSEERRQRAEAERVIAFLRLQRYRHAVVGTLPYGVQKRVDLARALASRPKLLLLDEPLAGMTFEEKSEMREFILDVNRELGTTVVLIEHDMNVVMDVSDHVVVLDYGRKIGDGPPDAVREDPEVLRAYLGRRRNVA